MSTITKRLTGRVAVVTGASKGIGAAIAKQLADEGAAVVVNYASSKEGADRVVAEITGKGGKAVAVQANLAKQADIRAALRRDQEGVRQARHPGQQRGHLRVRPAGGRDARALPQAVRPERAGPDPRHAGSGQAVRPGRRQHHQHQFGGRDAGRRRTPRSTARPRRRSSRDAHRWPRNWGRGRSASTRSTPAWSRPKASHSAGITESDFRKQIEAQTPLGRIGQPQDIAPAAVFLASDDSAWITGETLYISGGTR